MVLCSVSHLTVLIITEKINVASNSSSEIALFLASTRKLLVRTLKQVTF